MLGDGGQLVAESLVSERQCRAPGFTGRRITADERLEPASLTKLMTAYVSFKALQDGRIELDEQARVSEKAWRTQGSRMFIEVGNRVRVKDLLLGVIVGIVLPVGDTGTATTGVPDPGGEIAAPSLTPEQLQSLLAHQGRLAAGGFLSPTDFGEQSKRCECNNRAVPVSSHRGLSRRQVQNVVA